jgi:hypothetical protein
VDKRTTIQLAVLLIGLIVWGYGQRIDEPTLRLVGIALFSAATLLRFFRRSDTRHHEPDAGEEPSDHGLS